MGSASADCINLYHGNASLLAESLEVIQQASTVILAALDHDPHATGRCRSEILVYLRHERRKQAGQTF